MIQIAANKMAMLDPECPVDELFSWVCSAHNEMFRVEGASPDQVIFGKNLRPLDSELQGTVRQHEAEATEGTPAEAQVSGTTGLRGGPGGQTGSLGSASKDARIP